ncbi:MAG: acyl-ACP--UDP-N-acetylglucosamine O-acyltransferase [Planctomycetes bacterium]|nr:acyl-ACP--UDP-N-acetylglucosamine O-acyltransferase [Planctomycetota bacterium]
MSRIHPTASVHPRAVLADDVVVGPFAVIGEHCRIGPGCRIDGHAVVEGHTTLGAHNHVYPFAVLGSAPQDLTYRDEPTTLVIGSHNTFREYSTVNVGTVKGGGCTRLGDHNLLMASTHVAHDCRLENNIVIANGVLFGGHVKVESDATFGGLAALHHFVTVGARAFVGGMTRVVQDVPPYMTVEGNPAKVRCVNIVGLKRRSVSAATIEELKEAHKLLFRAGVPRPRAISLLEQKPGTTAELRHLVAFLKAQAAGRQGRALEAHRKVAPQAGPVAGPTPTGAP